MLMHIPDVLTREQVALARQRLQEAGWADGKATAGYQSAQAKQNLQLPESDPAARALGSMILDALGHNDTFLRQPCRGGSTRRCSIAISRARPSASTSTTPSATTT